MARFKIVHIVKEIYYCEAESRDEAELLLNNDFLAPEDFKVLDTEYIDITKTWKQTVSRLGE